MTRALSLATLLLALAPQAARGLPLISEVFYDAAGSDNGQGFVELYGTPGDTLDGLTLEGVNGANGAVGPTVTLTGVFGDDGLFVVADDAGDGSTSVANADLIQNFDFQNGPDSIVLRDASGVIDAVGYGVFAPEDVFAGEGSPAPDAPADASLARWFADVDTNDNAADFTVLSTPTPGSALVVVVPEPQTAVLLAAGLTALAAGGRRRARR